MVWPPYCRPVETQSEIMVREGRKKYIANPAEQQRGMHNSYRCYREVGVNSFTFVAPMKGTEIPYIWKWVMKLWVLGATLERSVLATTSEF